jgi:hypothetical protein
MICLKEVLQKGQVLYLIVDKKETQIFFGGPERNLIQIIGINGYKPKGT